MASQFKRAAAVLALVLIGCVETNVDPAVFNKPLRGDPPEDNPKRQAEELPISCVRTEWEIKEDPPAVYPSVCLRPGMVLVVNATDAGRTDQNRRTIVQSAFEWRIPTSGEFSQADLFKLSQLIAVSHDQGGFDAAACYEAWMKAEAGAALRQQFLKPLLDSLRVEIQPNGLLETAGEAYTAARLQGWTERLPNTALNNSVDIDTRQVLVFSFPLIPTGTSQTAPTGDCFISDASKPIKSLRAFDGGSLYQLARDKPGEKQPSNSWYNGEPTKSRIFLDVLVPVQVEGRREEQYISYASSICDAEARFGAKILAVVRDPRLLPDESGATILRFVSSSQYAGAGEVPVKDTIKNQLLVAPGDRYLLGQQEPSCGS